MPCRRITLAFLLLCTCFASAQYRTGLPKPEPALNTVREFCRQDFGGGRLTPEGWAHMKQLTTWKDNPQWREFRIVSRYEQTAASTSFHNARVDMQYQVLGSFHMGIGYTAIGTSENVEFKLRETDGEWRIEETDPEQFAPHISKQRAVLWLQDKLKTATDAADKISIEATLKELQGAAR
jgi:hypothetical protein